MTTGVSDGRGASVLLIEDEQELADEVRLELEAAGHSVETANSFEDGLRGARSGWASILLVDRMLNGADGLSIVETLRREGDLTPVLVISALSTVDERIGGLKAGGDDYLVKPFDLRELSARVEALLRRGGDARATRIKVGVLEMDKVDRKVRCAGLPVDLLPREC